MTSQTAVEETGVSPSAAINARTGPPVSGEPGSKQWHLTAFRLVTGQTSSVMNRTGWLLFGVLAIILAGQAFNAVDPQDEGTLLIHPWLIAHGSLPYRDIFLSYPPGIYVALAALVKIGIPGLVAERGVGFVARLALVLIINFALTGSWRRFSWIGALCTFSLMFCASDLKAYPWMVGLPIMALGLLAARDRFLTAGLLFFVAGLLRFEFALAGLVTLGVLALPIPFQRNEWRRLFYACSAALALLAGGLLVYFFFDRASGGSAIRQVFLDQIFVVQARRYIPILQLPFGPLGIPAFALTLAGPPIMVLLGLLSRRRYMVATNLGLLTLVPHYLQRADASHLFGTAALVVPWMLIGLTDVLRDTVAETQQTGWLPLNPWRRRLTSVSSAGVGTIGVFVGIWYTLVVLAYAVYISPLSPLSNQPLSSLSSRVVQSHHMIVASSSVQARDDREVVDYIAKHAGMHQKVFIVPATFRSWYTRTDLYYVLGLPPATRYLDFQSMIEAEPGVQHEIVRDLRSCTWIIVLRGGAWYYPDPLEPPRLDHTAVTQYILHHFHAVMHNGSYQVLRSATSST